MAFVDRLSKRCRNRPVEMRYDSKPYTSIGSKLIGKTYTAKYDRYNVQWSYNHNGNITVETVDSQMALMTERD